MIHPERKRGLVYKGKRAEARYVDMGIDKAREPIKDQGESEECPEKINKLEGFSGVGNCCSFFGGGDFFGSQECSALDGSSESRNGLTGNDRPLCMHSRV